MRAYILRLVCAALISGVLLSLLKGEGSRRAVKLLCGIFLTLTLLQPLSKVDLDGLLDIPMADAGEAYIQAGEEMAQEAMASYIKREVEAYIQDKAQAIDPNLQVEVSLGKDPPIPVAAQVHGRVSPSGKSRLLHILEAELGIPKERVTWTG